jgi:hypothetical protein
MGIDDQAAKLQIVVMGYIKKFLQFVAILSLPFYSLVSKWIFKKHKLYYAEHLTINSYLFAHITLIQIFTIILVALVPSLSKLMLLFGSLIFILYYTYAFKGLFNIKWVKSFLSSAAIYVIGMLLMIIFVVLTTIVVLIILKFSGVNLKELVQ